MKNTHTLNGLISNSINSAVAAIINIGEFNIFSSPSKFVKLKTDYIPFHCLGGRCKQGEYWADALKREITEETDDIVTLLSAPKTLIVTSDKNRQNISLSDNPKPSYIYKRTLMADTNFHHQHIQWVVGYNGILTKATLLPHKELAFILYLSDDMLLNCLTKHINYQDIINSKDGSRMVIRNGFKFNCNKRAIPEGLAFVLANNLLFK